MNEIISGRERALKEIKALANAHNLSVDDIGAALLQERKKDKGGSLLSGLLGYLGAALIFGGLALFIGMQWDVLPSAARVIVTYGVGFAAYIFAIAVLKDGRYAGASNALFFKSALLMPTGMFVFLHEYAKGDDGQLAAIIVFAVLAFQFAVTFAKLRNGASLFFGYLFFNTSVALMLDYIGIDKDIVGMVMGISILIVSWKIDATPYRAIAPVWYGVGGMMLLFAAFDLFEGGPFDVLLSALAAGMMFASIRAKSRTLLTVGTLGLLAFLGYYTDEYFKDIVGWPIALIIAGFALVGTSSWALKIGRTIRTGA